MSVHADVRRRREVVGGQSVDFTEGSSRFLG